MNVYRYFGCLVTFAIVGAFGLGVAPSASAALTFTPPSTFSTGNSPYGVTSADFDGDGIRDLATSNTPDDTVSVLLGTGAGSFGANRDFAVGSSPRSVASADFNQDGKPDLVIANNFGSSLSVLLGTGTGNFSPKTDFVVGPGPLSVTTADFNGDGVQDVASAQSAFPYNASILFGTGTGSFSPPTDVPVGDTSSSIAAADFNGDGNQDLVVAHLFSNTISVVLGPGFGSFTDYTVGEPASVTVADFNDDGLPDLATANSAIDADSISVLLGTGNGIFGATVDYPAGGSPQSVISADFNGDRIQDLASTNFSNTVAVLPGVGDGTFGPSSGFDSGGSSLSLISADFNGDGMRDVATGFFGSSAVSVLLNSPTATASPISLDFPVTALTTNSDPQTVVISNDGLAPLNIGGFSFTGDNPNDFFVSSDTCRRVVRSAQSCEVGIRFSAGVTGSRSSNLVISSNIADTVVSLAGTGGLLPQGPTGDTGAIGDTGSTGETGPKGGSATLPKIALLHADQPVRVPASRKFGVIEVTCPANEDNTACEFMKATARAKVRGQVANAKVLSPETIEAGQSARVKVQIKSKSRKRLLKNRKSGVSILTVKVASGNGGLLYRTVRTGLMK